MNTKEENRLRTCPSCGVTQPLTNFNKDRNRTCGHVSACKECKKVYMKKWRTKTPEEKEAWHKSIEERRRKCIRCEVPFLKKEVEERSTKPTYCPACERYMSNSYYIRNHETVKKRHKDWAKTPEGRESKRRTAKLMYQNMPAEKKIAYGKMTYAIQSGKLVRQPCQECGDTKVDGHHHNGYSKEHWYDVQWLCRKHHLDAHKFTLESRGLI